MPRPNGSTEAGPSALIYGKKRTRREIRVELVDGDARKLPFPDNSFDVILSSWALHNIYDPAGRETAVGEIVRVLKPGGRLAIADIRHTRQYAQALARSRMTNIQRRGPNFLFFIPTFTLTAAKQ